MLDLPEITFDDFETQLANFINHASLYNSAWNMQGEHSIGMVLAELFVFLKVTQQENMNKITPESLTRICKLAGGGVTTLTPSSCAVSVNGTGELPLGTKLAYSGVVFETAESIKLTENDIEKISYLDNDAVNSSNYIANGNISVRLFEKHDNFVIGFKKPLETGAKLQLFISLGDNNRTPVTDRESFLNVIGRNNLRWLYYGLEKETVGWHELITSDGTLSLLFSGIISFTAGGTHYEKDGCYPVMCVLENDFYDAYPDLKQIYLNAAECVQTDTKCASVNFTYDEFLNDSMYINHFLAETELFKLFIKSGCGFVLFDAPGNTPRIIYEGGRLRLAVSDKNRIREIFDDIGDLNEDTVVITMILYENNNFPEYVSDGTSNMKFKLNYTDVLCERLSVMVGSYLDGALHWEEWSYVPDLLYCGPDDKVFTFSGDLLITGDNKNGKIPDKSFDGKYKNIIVSSLATSSGANGNIPAGTFECSALTADLDSVIRINDSVDGKNRELPEEMLNNILRGRAEGTLVTKADFINAAITTEGLLIDKATCELPYDKNGEIEPNSVNICVYPSMKCNSLRKLEWYKKAVSHKLMKYKPLTLKLNITFPE